MKMHHLLAATAALALSAGIASAQAPAQDNRTAADPTATPSTSQMPPSSSPTGSVHDATASGAVGAAAQSETTVSSSSTTDNSSSTQAVTTTSASTVAADASVTTSMTTNGPVPDTAENRAKYGRPLSNAGKRTAARGN